ncbi:30S ribosomal protein S5 [Candidatus Parcubacteria bacterium]|nr:30S ribosomal protein S5 [Candidatus Parcubacteria bacterium]
MTDDKNTNDIINTTDDTTEPTPAVEVIADAIAEEIEAAVEAAPAPEVEAPTTEAENVVEAPVAPAAAQAPRAFVKNDRPQRGGPRRDSRGPKREAKPKPEFDQKIVAIRRVTRVTSGGRKFSFAVAVIAGDKKGRIGFGTGKGLDTAMAVDKAYKKAKANMIRLPLTSTGTIPHEVSAKYSSAQVELRPAPGKGIVAGSSVRDVIEIAGIRDVIGKLRSGTKNRMNNAKVVIKALSTLSASKKIKHTK